MISNLPFLLVVTCVIIQVAPPTANEGVPAVTDDSAEQVDVAKDVQVDPINSDDRIERRLQEIMEATGWFDAPQVRVDRGVAFITGTADTKRHQEWAEATAMNTSDVVAVVNRTTVAKRPLWNVAPAIASLQELSRDTTEALPLVAVAIFIAILSYYLATFSASLTRRLARNRIDNQLLRQVLGNVVGVLMFIIGVYVALRVSGLTRLAITLLGGTGLVGLALGFAFRDIAENYLASILISLHHPFRVGDLIEVEGAVGFVRKVTTRGTVLNTLEGNQIQMPNSTVYKGKITNYTATPLSRREFTVGIGFDDSITKAQTILMEVLTQHNAVVVDPAPMVIVQSLGSATVNLNVLYWFDQTKHSPLKISSSVIRQAKQRLTEAEITMPDEAREIVFPAGVPVNIIEEVIKPRKTSQPEVQQQEPEASIGEGDLSTEQQKVMQVTCEDDTIENKTNLIG